MELSQLNFLLNNLPILFLCDFRAYNKYIDHFIIMGINIYQPNNRDNPSRFHFKHKRCQLELTAQN